MPVHGIVGIFAIVGMVEDQAVLDELSKAGLHSSEWSLGRSECAKHIEGGAAIGG